MLFYVIYLLKSKENSLNLSVVGLGSWGTALAQSLSSKFQNVYIWGRDKLLVEAINKKHINEKYLPEIRLNENIVATNQLNEVFEKADIIIIAIPSQAIKDFVKKTKDFNLNKKLIISASKGIDIQSLKLISDIFMENLPISENQIFALSGPSFAKEVALGLPTAITLGGEIHNAKYLQDILNTKNLRFYITEDLKGVEIGGAVKNVISIATGISDGLGLGNNARAALITRGLYEMTKIVNIYGGKVETLYGLAGVGDLVLTATGDLSRNRKFGFLIGKGYTVNDALKAVGQTVEGVETSKAVQKIKDKYNLELPIAETVYKIIYENLPPAKAIDILMSRQPTKEFI